MAFYLLTFAITWGLWVPAALSGQNISQSAWMIVYFLGGFGPSIAGIILTYRAASRQERRDFWLRAVQFSRISPGWQAFIWLVYPLVFGVSIALDWLTSGSLPGTDLLSQAAVNPLILPGTILFLLIAGPVSEELGWRGYALDRLQAHRSPLSASLILGALWWLWHLPLFFIRGTAHYEWGLFSLNALVFLLVAFPQSVLMTWTYNHNRRSILAAILLHFTYPLTLNLIYPLSEFASLLHALLLILVATVMVLMLKNRKPAQPPAAFGIPRAD